MRPPGGGPALTRYAHAAGKTNVLQRIDSRPGFVVWRRRRVAVDVLQWLCHWRLDRRTAGSGLQPAQPHAVARRAVAGDPAIAEARRGGREIDRTGTAAGGHG